ncbi:DeoR/GlpR family DNA-binding transcription regulator [Alteribacillus sp. HJP-4]|uniref:DeoR/GlpR family DNA-binding transcription regulator n=1 Tax=Alteribacillus sp. HJP-4 TaxID=2775394 RepID=UPI0035CCC9B7
MILIERQKRIKDILMQQRSVRVQALAKEFNVSEETIRRDLNQLEKDGLVKKNYGGAVLLKDVQSAMNAIVPVDKRKLEHYQEKDAIGRRAKELVKENEIVFLDAGSTTWCVARHLNQLEVFTAITNGLNIADEFGHNESISLFLIGGGLDRKTMSFVPSRPEQDLRPYNADIAFIGTTGISMKKSFASHNMYEAEVKRAMIESAKKTVIVADHSKLIKQGLISFCDFEDIDILITSDLADEDIIEDIRSHGVEVIVTAVKETVADTV